MFTGIENLPKAELHLHIEGTLEPDMMFSLAKRNKIELPFRNVKEIQAQYNFNNLQSFLNIYYQSMQVLRYEQDFYDLTFAYLKRVKHDNVKVVEIFFDPQAHTARGVAFDAVIKGIYKALADGENEFGIKCGLILCFLRDLSEEDAFKTLEKALDYKDCILGIGLDSAEKNNPPAKFKNVFKQARDHGFKLVAHAGEEGPAEYIWQALDELQVQRIDHGIKCIDDAALVKRLRDEKIPLTVCPLSNVRLKVVDSLETHPLKRMLDAGLCVTINSDDPAYFDGYINQNYIAVQQALSLSEDELKLIAANSLNSAFLKAAK